MSTCNKMNCSLEREVRQMDMCVVNIWSYQSRETEIEVIGEHEQISGSHHYTWRGSFTEQEPPCFPAFSFCPHRPMDAPASTALTHRFGFLSGLPCACWMLFWCRSGPRRLLESFPGFSQPGLHEQALHQSWSLDAACTGVTPGGSELALTCSLSHASRISAKARRWRKGEMNWALRLYFVHTSNAVKNPPGAAAQSC